eukprot:8336442-Pyramimonas_sp.AAC.1
MRRRRRRTSPTAPSSPLNSIPDTILLSTIMCSHFPLPAPSGLLRGPRYGSLATRPGKKPTKTTTAAAAATTTTTATPTTTATTTTAKRDR